MFLDEFNCRPAKQVQTKKPPVHDTVVPGPGDVPDAFTGLT